MWLFSAWTEKTPYRGKQATIIGQKCDAWALTNLVDSCIALLVARNVTNPGTCFRKKLFLFSTVMRILCAYIIWQNAWGKTNLKRQATNTSMVHLGRTGRFPHPS